MKYRIENVFIPETAGIAHPEDSNDKSQLLKGRRIIHVQGVEPTNGGARARVLTEEDE